MSTVPKEAIEVIAQSIGITNLSPDVALALAPDVEYRVREIMQVWHFEFGCFEFLLSLVHLWEFCSLYYVQCKCSIGVLIGECDG